METQWKEDHKRQIEGTWKVVRTSPTTFPEAGQEDRRTRTATPKTLDLQKNKQKTEQKCNRKAFDRNRIKTLQQNSTRALKLCKNCTLRLPQPDAVILG